jgi:hypothetical protein
MSLTLIATPKATNANSYATVAEADTYHDSIREQADLVWSALHTGKKERLLVQATRLIDEHFVFLGYKSDSNQALHWPRAGVVKDGKYAHSTFQNLDEDTIPQFIKDATAEFARILSAEDTTADDDTAGFKQIMVQGISLTMDQSSRVSKGVIRSSVYSILRKYGDYIPPLNAGSGGIGQNRTVRA